MEAFEGAGESGDVGKVTHFGEFSDAVPVGGEEFSGKFHACFKDESVERCSCVFEKKFPQIDLRNAAFGGKACGGKIFKGVGEDALDKLTEFESIRLAGNGTAFSGKTEINQVFYLNDSPGVIKFGGMEIAVNGFKNLLYFFGVFGAWSHFSVGKGIEKSVVDSASAFAVKIDPDMAVFF